MAEKILQFPIAIRLMADMRLALKGGDITEITRLYYQMFPGDIPCEHGVATMWCESCKGK